jgi:hypothetical protein
MFPAPPMPTFPPEHSVTGSGYCRYEDVTQDGRLIPLGIPPSMGFLWRDRLVGHEGARNALAAGIIPILTRITLTSFDQQIRVDRPCEYRAGFELAHDRRGEETRLFMNVWAETRGAAGKLSRHVVPGELALAGTIFAEHTFTRLMAPPDQRRVERLDVPGYPPVPETRYAAPPPASAQDAPEGASWLDDLAPDSAELCCTLDQTDSNQHVNSLVYIRLFGDAAQRRLAAAGRPGRLRSRAVDIAYRKPSFAGDRLRAHLRLFAIGDAIGAAGTIAAADEAKPRCYVRVVYGP